MEITLKAGRRCFSQRFLVLIIIFFASIVSFRLGNFAGKRENSQNTSSLGQVKYLDRDLEDRLVEEVKQALLSYNKENWWSLYDRLNRVRQACRQGGCDPEVFFNDSLDLLANELTEEHFTQAGVTLGIIYGGNWKLADLDGDGMNEMIVLQRDALNVASTSLKVFNFSKENRRSVYKLSQGYFSSPNSSGQGTLPLEVRDLDNDGLLEVLAYVTSGRGGANLYVFEYKDSRRLELIYKKDDVDYPEYTFTDVDKNGILDIIVEGFRGGTKVRESTTL